ncbi:hypothetical protein F8A90_01140 [Cobetia sp. cqz5-12]|uniref:hypothetical protein n=1 Tax=Cobetia sp. cqz5-12 TaxID=2609415 RepID=UPI00190449B0|nr:hypothetical protein [Cobetia sp. cqz5-12]QQK62903.1 hypothetical protein F8A90_01140 [Cobetia sp. cqz5-12]
MSFVVCDGEMPVLSTVIERFMGDTFEEEIVISDSRVGGDGWAIVQPVSARGTITVRPEALWSGRRWLEDASLTASGCEYSDHAKAY